MFYECSKLELLAGKFFARSSRVHDPGGVSEGTRAVSIPLGRQSSSNHYIHNIISSRGKADFEVHV